MIGKVTNNISIVLIVLTALSYVNLAMAQKKSVVVLSDTVTGNQEQPKVLYIVPWQTAEDNTILEQPLKSRLQRDVFGHIERPEHLRELKYLKQLSQTKNQETQ